MTKSLLELCPARHYMFMYLNEAALIAPEPGWWGAIRFPVAAEVYRSDSSFM